jgi:putative phosphonate metabolism protein
MEDAPRYAIYFVPAPETDLYRFGSAVLGHDCYTGEAVPYPDDLGIDAANWSRITAEPRRYGFHATLKAPFRLNGSRSEGELSDAVHTFAAGGREVPTIIPAVAVLASFVALVSSEPEPSLDRLAAQCTTAFDCFRAPLAAEERARRLAQGLTAAQIANLDRFGYPYVLADFRFHMTLTASLAGEERGAIVDALRESFERRCGYRPIAIDGLTLLKQPAPGAAFRVIGQAQLRAAG